MRADRNASSLRETYSARGLSDLGGRAHDQLVNEGSLALARPQDASHPLHMLPFAEATCHHDSHLGIRNVDTFVQDPRRDERPENPAPEALEGRSPLLAADIAGEGHDAVFARHAVSLSPTKTIIRSARWRSRREPRRRFLASG